MSEVFDLMIPKSDGSQLSITLKVGEVLYLLGANGTGKSSLVTHLVQQHQDRAVRISAHRQTWFASDWPEMTPQSRHQIDQNIRSYDRQPVARYREWDGAARSNMAIYDLIDADNMQERKIAKLLREGDEAAAKLEAKIASPIQVINELMNLSNLPISIELEAGQKIVVKKNDGKKYGIAELSDGERNAFLLAAPVLTAISGSIFVIDEPERHLHRSIISPLLKLLFDKRKDCAFIVSTHEIMLPIDTPTASTLLLRDCHFDGQHVDAWTVDQVAPGTEIDETLRRDILGARRRIMFVEGTRDSLDTPLYSVLFPQVSVVPKEGCREVERAVIGIRSTSAINWIEAWGVVDNDQRSSSEISRLQENGIWALDHYSVESLYYHPNIVARIAKRQSEFMGVGAVSLFEGALNGGIKAVSANKAHLVEKAVVRSTRIAVLDKLPVRDDIRNTPVLNLEVDIEKLRREEEGRIDQLIAAEDWDGLLTHYPLRESSAFDSIVTGLKMIDRSTYQAAVLKLLQDEVAALEELRSLFGDLYSEIMSSP